MSFGLERNHHWGDRGGQGRLGPVSGEGRAWHWPVCAGPERRARGRSPGGTGGGGCEQPGGECAGGRWAELPSCPGSVLASMMVLLVAEPSLRVLFPPCGGAPEPAASAWPVGPSQGALQGSLDRGGARPAGPGATAGWGLPEGGLAWAPFSLFLRPGARPAPSGAVGDSCAENELEEGRPGGSRSLLVLSLSLQDCPGPGPAPGLLPWDPVFCGLRQELFPHTRRAWPWARGRPGHSQASSCGWVPGARLPDTTAPSTALEETASLRGGQRAVALGPARFVGLSLP